MIGKSASDSNTWYFYYELSHSLRETFSIYQLFLPSSVIPFKRNCPELYPVFLLGSVKHHSPQDFRHVPINAVVATKPGYFGIRMLFDLPYKRLRFRFLSHNFYFKSQSHNLDDVLYHDQLSNFNQLYICFSPEMSFL